ncbi:hypothetical protein GGR51DRAFT_552159 [Nemania sp. FL0031]|nr:hypothetical protein GGR51DRAFT_552159 [Nemania sp. FL0031]
MEGTVSHKEVRERLHRRALSQASTTSSTMHSPKTTKSTSTSSSHPRAITPSNAPHTHRYNHSQYDKETMGIRLQPRLSRESNSEPKQPMTPVSSLLQERLQQERKAESERLASRWGTDLSSSTGDIRDGDTSNSSGKRYKPVVERRPGSSNDDDSSQNGMGAKQIEKAVSTLHKQNFDLKLELFHRREKQSALEARVEELETERRELTDIQENLLSELVKRDKAIEEAVNMIVKLEARVDELVQENEMARRIEADGSYPHSWSDISDSLRTETPKPSDRNTSLSVTSKTLERMPSFLSDRSAHTQHLRSVVLQNRSSLRHIRKVSEVSASSADVSEVNRISSPSLSMLSESSFVSIYGSKQDQDGVGTLSLDHLSGTDGTFGNRSPTPTKKTVTNTLPNQDNAAFGRPLNLPSRPATSLSNQPMTANNVFRRESPLQRGERLGGKVTPLDDTFRPFTSSRRRSVVTPTPPQAMSKRDRRETLQRVMTNYPTQRELANSHALPPTPDTVSSSVLRKHKDPSSSQDSLPRSDDAQDPNFPTVSLPHNTEYLRSLASQEARPGLNVQKPMPRNRAELPTSGFMKVDQDRLLSDLGHLARSAANTATTGRPRSDSFASDSDSDGGADARSDSESCDYWMRESYKPDRDNVRSSARRERRHAPSPDLFSFPVDSEGWQPDVMFGALKGGGFLGSPVPALRRDPVDELASSLQAPLPFSPLEPVANGPEPPSRRSSLHAQVTGHLLASLTGKTGRGSSRENSVVRPDARGRSNSVDMALSGTRIEAGPSKRSQYPPIAGLQSRTRGLGLNSLFRRSGSESYGTPSGTMEATLPSAPSQRGPTVPPPQLRHLQRPSGRNSVPPPATTPWAMRPMHMAEDDLASATPPPIMRNRPPPLQTDLGPASTDVMGSETLQATEAGACPATPSTVIDTTTPVAAPSAAGVRKWLGLGRKASPKTRVG